MIIGIPREVKPGEHRIAITPAAVRELKKDGHRLLIEAGAGEKAGIKDDQLRDSGAEIIDCPADIWNDSGLVVKVKEPIESEYRFFHEDLILFTFLHLAADRPLTVKLLEKRMTALAYETLQTADGRLPLLTPMSQIAGKIGAQEAACLMSVHKGGKGKLIGGAVGVAPATVMIIGAGVSGISAAEVSMGMGARVIIYDIDPERLRMIDRIFNNCTTIYSTEQYISEWLEQTDIILGCVLVAGARAPVVISRKMVRKMMPGGVIVDIAIDQGGCIETSRPTTPDHPTFIDEGIVHYCVTNMPGTVPLTSTLALSNATLPYIQAVAGADDPMELFRNDPQFGKALNTCKGKLTSRPVAEALGLPFEAF